VREAARLVDALLPERALVFGSPPDNARDLDLLVRPAAEEALLAGLPAKGFLRRERRLVRFRACTAEVVDLFAAAGWDLPPEEVDALFARARPLEGLERLVRPAPEHALLILARRVSEGDGRLDHKLRMRLEAVLDEDDQAWERARERADAWHAVLALQYLEHPYRRRLRVTASRRAEVRAERLRARGVSPRRAAVRAWRSEAPRVPRGMLITLSGLDGSGKSTQADALVDALERLGHDPVHEWTRVTFNPVLRVISAPVKRAVHWVSGGRDAPPGSSFGSAADHPATALRERSPALTQVWSTIVAVVNGLAQARAARRHLLSGRIVVFDRYTLDSRVQLKVKYGEQRSFALQTWLIRALSPRPSLAWLLDVSPDTAYRRKGDHSLEDYERQARLYREEHRRLGVERLDGERPREELCEHLAREVWERLAARE